MLAYIFVLAVCCAAVIAEDPCSPKVDRGTDCNHNSTIRYFFDSENKDCYPFKFNGCGGNLNNFGSHKECHRRCHPEGMMADVQHCPGGKPTGTCNERIRMVERGSTGTTPKPEPVCPEGSYCQSGHPVSICCDKKLRDQAEKEAADNKPTCPKGKKVVQREVFKGYNVDVLGKKCEHEFCSTGSSCVQKKKTAFCCQ